MKTLTLVYMLMILKCGELFIPNMTVYYYKRIDTLHDWSLKNKMHFHPEKMQNSANS